MTDRADTDALDADASVTDAREGERLKRTAESVPNSTDGHTTCTSGPAPRLCTRCGQAPEEPGCVRDAAGRAVDVMLCRRCDAPTLEALRVECAAHLRAINHPQTDVAATAAASVRDRIAQALDDYAGGLASIDPDNDYSAWSRAASFVRRLTPGELGQ